MLTLGGLSGGVFKLIMLILLFCILGRGGHVTSPPVREGTSGCRHKGSGLFNPLAKENRGRPLQALNGHNSLLSQAPRWQSHRLVMPRLIGAR